MSVVWPGGVVEAEYFVAQQSFGSWPVSGESLGHGTWAAAVTLTSFIEICLACERSLRI